MELVFTLNVAETYRQSHLLILVSGRAGASLSPADFEAREGLLKDESFDATMPLRQQNTPTRGLAVVISKATFPIHPVDRSGF